MRGKLLVLIYCGNWSRWIVLSNILLHLVEVAVRSFCPGGKFYRTHILSLNFTLFHLLSCCHYLKL